LFLATPNTTESEIDARELAKMIEEFLDMQTTENRVIFMRRYWFSDSYKNIANQMGLSEKAVSVRLTRIRRNLREFLIQKEVLV
jgi:RNA polymerase sigma factor (sigma-70 family)